MHSNRVVADRALRKMKVSVLINNYNYAEYIEECLNSVGQQSSSADETIVVDDGSTDHSVEVIKRHPLNVTCITQSNQGQLKAIATAVERATGDILCFLDSDDRWKPGYLQEIITAYNGPSRPDFVYVGLERFGKKDGAKRLCGFSTDTLIPASREILLAQRIYVGAPTSGNSIRAHIAKDMVKAITPTQFEDYRINADNLLVFGASLIGCRKMQLRALLVDYRVHAKNNYYWQERNAKTKIADKLKREQLISELAQELGLESDIYKLYDEFREQLEYTCEKSKLIKAYLKAPKKFKKIYKPYWRIRFWLTYRIAKLKLNKVRQCSH